MCVFVANLLVLLHGLLFGLDDDALQLVEASLHLREAEAGLLLFAADALQLLLAQLLRNARTLLPLLDALRQDLIDTAKQQASKQTNKQQSAQLEAFRSNNSI